MHTREIQILNMTIQVPNSVQPINGLSVILTAAEIIMNKEKQVIGHPNHRQQYMIPEDMTPDLVEALNSSLASVGYKLTPIAEE